MSTSHEQNPGCLSAILRLFRGSTTSQASSKEDSAELLPYRVRDDFLSSSEFSFYKVLATVVNGKAIICPKVRLADIFYVPRSNESFRYQNKISQKHVDYLLCDPDTMQPLLGIELDDSSHSRPDREERDEFVEAAFEAANLPLVRFVTQRGYNPQSVAAVLAPHLSTNATTQQPAAHAAPPVSASTTPPLCPKCGSPMVVRSVKQGEHKGKQFYGCSNYPNCRQMLPITGS